MRIQKIKDQLKKLGIISAIIFYSNACKLFQFKEEEDYPNYVHQS